MPFRINDSSWVAPPSDWNTPWRRPYRTDVQPADPRRQPLDWGDAIDTVEAQQDLDPPEDYDPRGGLPQNQPRSLQQDVTRAQLRAPGRDAESASEPPALGIPPMELVRGMLDPHYFRDAAERSAAARQRGDWGRALFESGLMAPAGIATDIAQRAGVLGMAPEALGAGVMRAGFRAATGFSPLRAGTMAGLESNSPDAPGLLNALFSNDGILANAVRAGRRPSDPRQSWMGRNEQYGPPNPYLPDFAR